MLGALCEEVEKIVSALEHHDLYRIANALPSLAAGLSQAVAVARGILVETENRWLLQVEESVGADSPWSRAHQKMLGIDNPSSTTIWDRAQAGLRCYLETAALFADFLQPGDGRVVELARREIGVR
ncbi:MAG: hypothetical protein L3K13_07980 [Thermoplasmata archaeon]|nr:hypothetical protein [Thermoplasmata archaeon]